jgi:hypothetical protein
MCKGRHSGNAGGYGMKTTYFVFRNGQIKINAINLEKAENGSLWENADNRNPLLNKTIFEKNGFTVEQIAEFCRNGQFEKIPKEAFCKEGMNPDDLEVITLAEHQNRAKKKREEELASRTPAQIERDEIRRLFFRAKQEEDNPHDSVMYWKYKGEANHRLEQWKKDFPDDWKREQAQDLILQAEKQDELGVGALVYDCDGLFDENEKQRRHDQFIARSAELRKQADELLKEVENK